MVAEPIAFQGPSSVPLLPLLLEPDPPQKQHGGWKLGWQGSERRYSDDILGALVQHTIVRYVVHGIQRQELSRETGYSERQIQAWIGGVAAVAYAAPVRRALTGLGIRVARGQRWGNNNRANELIEAMLTVLDGVKDDLCLGAEGVKPLHENITLLLAGREPLNGRVG